MPGIETTHDKHLICLQNICCERTRAKTHTVFCILLKIPRANEILVPGWMTHTCPRLIDNMPASGSLEAGQGQTKMEGGLKTAWLRGSAHTDRLMCTLARRVADVTAGGPGERSKVSSGARPKGTARAQPVLHDNLVEIYLLFQYRSPDLQKTAVCFYVTEAGADK